MTLLDVLSMNDRVLVWAEHGVIVTWNLSLTLQLWAKIGEDEYEEIDVRTLSNCRGFKHAREAAKAWCAE